MLPQPSCFLFCLLVLTYSSENRLNTPFFWDLNLGSKHHLEKDGLTVPFDCINPVNFPQNYTGNKIATEKPWANMLSVPQLISDLQFKIRQLLLCFGFQGEDIIKWPQRHKTFYRQIVPSLQLMISDVGFFSIVMARKQYPLG